MPIAETTPVANFYVADPEPTVAEPSEEAPAEAPAEVDAAAESTEEVAPEGAEETAEEVSGKPDKVSAAFTALAKREKKLNRRRAELEATQKQFESQRAEWSRAIEQANQIIAQASEWKKNPLKALEALGTDYEALTKQVLSGEVPQEAPEVVQLRAEMQALREEMTRKERERFDLENRSRAEAAKNDAIRSLGSISRSEEQFPLASRMDPSEAADAAWQVMESVYASSGKIIDLSEAVEYVEEALQQQLQKFGVSVPSRGGAARVNGVARAAKPEADAAAQRRKPNTLTQRIASESSVNLDEMDSRQRDEYISKLIRWT
jgi:HAMP domain-containing protein